MLVPIQPHLGVTFSQALVATPGGDHDIFVSGTETNQMPDLSRRPISE